MALAKRQILVTSALPYANGAIHIGHLVGYIQADIWVRFQRLRGHDVVYLCGDDAHGTPIMLRARQEKLAPEQFIARMNQEHQADFARFDVVFDSYYSTHSPENRVLCERFYERLRQGGHIAQRPVEQFFDPVENIFLPDRFIKGTCPACGAADQYGDSCDACGKHYAPTDLIDPRSVVSGATPRRKSSPHLFLQLEDFRDQLGGLIRGGMVDAAVANKLQEWFGDRLKDWDISRDAPFFGFPIPGQTEKYFYNWLDAPIGYLASLAHYLRAEPAEAEDFWRAPGREIYHFIGKDIIYFHALFWPAMLLGAGLPPPGKLCVHGHLTINGGKMSKSRGTFISAEQYARHLDPQALRYYFATRLTATPADIDLHFGDFIARVNSELVGKLANLISRAAGPLAKLLEGRSGAAAPAAGAMLADFRTAAPEIATDYENRNYAGVTRRICALADMANKYVEEQAPWSMVKTAPEAARSVWSTALECGRILTIYLKPILPRFAEKVEQCLGLGPLAWADVEQVLSPRRLAPFEHLAGRIEERKIEVMVRENQTPVAPAAVAGPVAATSDRPTSGGSWRAGNESPKSPLGPTGAPSAIAQAPVTAEPLAATCTIEQFNAVDLRVARVLSAEPVQASEKLMRLELDLGALGRRTVLAGIKKAYSAEQLVGRQVIVCANLAPRKMKFGVSDGMILAAGAGGTDLALLSVESNATPGQRVH